MHAVKDAWSTQRSEPVHPLGRHRWSARGVNFSVFSRMPPAWSCCSSITSTTPARARTIRLDPAANRTYHYWHVFVPGVTAGQIYGYRVEGPFDPAKGMRFDPTKVLLDPYGRGVVVPGDYSREAACAAGDNAATAMKSVVVDPSRLRLGRRRPLAAALLANRHLRDARRGFTRHPNSGVPEETARHLRRPDREDPLSAGTRHHRGRTAAGLPVRCPGLPRRARSTTGATADLLLRAPPGLQLAPRPARAGRRIPGHGQGAAPRRHRGDSRRGLQPHRRRRRTTAPRSASAASTTPPITSSNRTARATPTTPDCGNTLNANHPIVRRMIVDSLRYWVEEMHVDGFRFDLASILSRDASGQSAAESAGPVGHRVRSGAGRHQAHRRGLGRRRAVSGRQLHRRQLEGMERPIPRRRPQLLPRRAGLGHALRRPDRRQPRDLRPQGTRGRSRASTSSPATTASPSTTWSPTTTSTTRPTARTTATAPTTTAAGTAASRGRPTTRPSRRCATGRSRTS